jgi:hypothetical protein
VAFEPQVPPAFLQQPLSQLVWALGTNAVLSASVIGTGPFNYQWLFNQTNLANATNSSLVITNFRAADAGAYSLLASNQAGYARSSPANLALVSVDIVTQPQNQTVRSGATASFNVIVSGTTPFYYQWLFNGAKLPGATNNTLVILNCQTTDTGSYSVVVTNAASSMTSISATLALETLSPPHLAAMQIGLDGSFQMLIVCDPQSNVEIQYSTDLINWQELLSSFTQSGTFRVADPNTVFDRQRFYRVIVTLP